jgi:hypothetical protein
VITILINARGAIRPRKFDMQEAVWKANYPKWTGMRDKKELEAWKLLLNNRCEGPLKFVRQTVHRQNSKPKAARKRFRWMLWRNPAQISYTTREAPNTAEIGKRLQFSSKTSTKWPEESENPITGIA